MERLKYLVSELKGWCHGEAHAVMVLTQEDVEISAIEETMQTVKCLGCVRVRGRIFNRGRNQYFGLCECKAKRFPLKCFLYMVEGRDETTRADAQFHMSSPQPADSNNAQKLQSLFPADEAAAKSTEAILRAVMSMEAIAAYVRSLGCCPLQLEKSSSITGWVKHGSWWKSVTALAKRRASDPDVSPEDCLEALEHAFGTAESGEELYFAFRLLQQQPDKARLEQLLHGAIASDLRRYAQKRNLKLHGKKINPAIQSANVKQNVEVKQTEIQNLKSEMRELKALVAAVVSKPSQDMSTSLEKPPTIV
ncbi:hypothetical protein N1851_021790 [Merluccius polli]|uniref:Paraneoplastic antigen Ma-like C-terminal domain-containing protein n=1 Tax=Merluccius polli TaxID=89951 RepID=A0AA47MJI1_MERPO|nr:hypothetical protein N1851_021790 [Merluccius polli]